MLPYFLAQRRLPPLVLNDVYGKKHPSNHKGPAKSSQRSTKQAHTKCSSTGFVTTVLSYSTSVSASEPTTIQLFEQFLECTLLGSLVKIILFQL